MVLVGYVKEMSTKTKKALQKAEAQKQTAVDITAQVPESEKVKIGGMDLNGTKPKKLTATEKFVEERNNLNKPKVDIESLKSRFSAFCKVTEDKSHFIALRTEDNSILHYITNTRKGVSLYARTNGNWKVADVLSTPEQIDAFITSVQREVTARAGWKDALTPIYIHGDFKTPSKTEMEQHLRSLL